MTATKIKNYACYLHIYIYINFTFGEKTDMFLHTPKMKFQWLNQSV